LKTRTELNEKEKPTKTTAKKRLLPADKLQLLRNLILHLPLLLVFSEAPNGLRYLRWGGGRRSRPARKMIRRRKLLEIAAESPASGARFVGQPCAYQNAGFENGANPKDKLTAV
jgi:hypothetical protein